jgi:hypothetical protein
MPEGFDLPDDERTVIWDEPYTSLKAEGYTITMTRSFTAPTSPPTALVLFRASHPSRPPRSWTGVVEVRAA